MVVSIGWFRIFTWKMVVSPSIHFKLPGKQVLLISINFTPKTSQLPEKNTQGFPGGCLEFQVDPIGILCWVCVCVCATQPLSVENPRSLMFKTRNPLFEFCNWADGKQSARFLPGENTVDGRYPAPPNMYETDVGVTTTTGGNNDYSNCRGNFSFYLSRLPPRLIYHINRCRISSTNSIAPKNGPKTKKTETIYRICILLVPSPKQKYRNFRIQISRTCFVVLALKMR